MTNLHTFVDARFRVGRVKANPPLTVLIFQTSVEILLSVTYSSRTPNLLLFAFVENHKPVLTAISVLSYFSI